MSGSFLWVTLGLSATLLWGVGYVFLKPVKDVNPMIIQTMFGFGSGLCNVLAMAMWSAYTSQSGAPFVEAWTSFAANETSLNLIGYVMCHMLAGLLFVIASQLENVPLSILTAMTSAYPVVTTVLVFVLFEEYKTVRLDYAVSGLVLTVTGCTLLALSPRSTD